MMTSIAAAHYTAFISYSHKDAAAARALHRRLEAYRVPRRLAGGAGDHGPVPARRPLSSATATNCRPRAT
ncbi:MAG: hypothetical protein WDN24_14620 [Sphingomonas sp.]